MLCAFALGAGALVPSAPYIARAQTADEARVDALMARMSLEQKIGQLLLVFVSGRDLSPSLQRSIDEYHAGGIVLFQDNISDSLQTVTLINAAQTAAISANVGIPLFVAVDQEGGTISRMPPNAALFPSQMALAATGDLDMAELMARSHAAQLKALGFNMNLAPVLDVNDNPDNPVIGTRSFGSDPQWAAQLGGRMVKAYKDSNIIAVVKHFPGHGNAAVDSHEALPVVRKSAEEIDAVELAPFKQMVWTGDADAVMTAHVAFPALDDSGLPATLSGKILGGVLRDRLGFRGLIVSDSMSMDAIDRKFTTAQAMVMAFRAGIDLLATGSDIGRFEPAARREYQSLLRAIRDEPALQQRLNESVRRILLTKARYGLLDWTAHDAAAADAILAAPEQLTAARAVAAKSVTLMRDLDGQLPLKDNDAVLLIAPRERDAVGFYDSTVLVDALRACHPKLEVALVDVRPGGREIRAVAARAQKADKTIVAVFNARFYTQQAALIRAVNRPIVAALRNPYDAFVANNAPAFVATFSDVSVSLEALASVLCGKAQAVGRMPVDLSRAQVAPTVTPTAQPSPTAEPAIATPTVARRAARPVVTRRPVIVRRPIATRSPPVVRRPPPAAPPALDPLPPPPP